MAGLLNQLKRLIVNVSSESKWDDFLVDNQQEVIKYLADNDAAPLMAVLETDGLEYGVTEAERQTILLSDPAVEIPQDITLQALGTGVIYHEKFAGGCLDGKEKFWNRNSKIKREGEGRWFVQLNEKHSNKDQYHISLTSYEDSKNRDAPDIHVVEGSQKVDSFSIQITTGDNSETADVYVDAPWSFSVNDKNNL